MRLIDAYPTQPITYTRTSPGGRWRVEYMGTVHKLTRARLVVRLNIGGEQVLRCVNPSQCEPRRFVSSRKE